MTQTTEQTTGATAPDAPGWLDGIAPATALARLRAQRPEVARYARRSYEALLEPDDPAGVSRYERELIGLRVAALTPSPALAERHRARLRALGATDAALAAIERGPDDPTLSPREAAILRHTDRLTLAPGEATPADLAELRAAGFSPRDIITIAQLIAYLSFESRVLAGLRLLAEER